MVLACSLKPEQVTQTSFGSFQRGMSLLTHWKDFLIGIYSRHWLTPQWPGIFSSRELMKSALLAILPWSDLAESHFFVAFSCPQYISSYSCSSAYFPLRFKEFSPCPKADVIACTFQFFTKYYFYLSLSGTHLSPDGKLSSFLCIAQCRKG